MDYDGWMQVSWPASMHREREEAGTRREGTLFYQGYSNRQLPQLEAGPKSLSQAKFLGFQNSGEYHS